MNIEELKKREINGISLADVFQIVFLEYRTVMENDSIYIDGIVFHSGNRVVLEFKGDSAELYSVIDKNGVYFYKGEKAQNIFSSIISYVVEEKRRREESYEVDE